MRELLIESASVEIESILENDELIHKCCNYNSSETLFNEIVSIIYHYDLDDIDFANIIRSNKILMEALQIVDKSECIIKDLDNLSMVLKSSHLQQVIVDRDTFYRIARLYCENRILKKMKIKYTYSYPYHTNNCYYRNV